MFKFDAVFLTPGVEHDVAYRGGGAIAVLFADPGDLKRHERGSVAALAYSRVNPLPQVLRRYQELWGRVYRGVELPRMDSMQTEEISGP
jgi:hypothetical protein